MYACKYICTNIRSIYICKYWLKLYHLQKSVASEAGSINGNNFDFYFAPKMRKFRQKQNKPTEDPLRGCLCVCVCVLVYGSVCRFLCVVCCMFGFVLGPLLCCTQNLVQHLQLSTATTAIRRVADSTVCCQFGL